MLGQKCVTLHERVRFAVERMKKIGFRQIRSEPGTVKYSIGIGLPEIETTFTLSWAQDPTCTCGMYLEHAKEKDKVEPYCEHLIGISYLVPDLGCQILDYELSRYS